MEDFHPCEAEASLTPTNAKVLVVCCARLVGEVADVREPLEQIQLNVRSGRRCWHLTRRGGMSEKRSDVNRDVESDYAVPITILFVIPRRYRRAVFA